MNNLPIIQCKKDQSILDAAHAAGYTNPTQGGSFRVGNMPQSQPLPWEKTVAWVRANRYLAPYPIFEKIYEEEKE